MTVGEKIKELRKKNDLTQEKLADFLRVSYQAVSKWECGLSSPDLSLIVPLARLFGVTTDELLGAASGDEDKRLGELADSAAEAIINAIIPDGNYCEYHHHMAHIQFRKAEMAVKSAAADRAVELLQRAAYHAGEFDIIDTVNPGEYAFTAPLLNKLTIDSREFFRRGTGTLTDDIKEM